MIKFNIKICPLFVLLYLLHKSDTYFAATEQICQTKYVEHTYYFRKNINTTSEQTSNCSITIVNYVNNMEVKTLRLGENDFVKLLFKTSNNQLREIKWINDSIENESFSLKSHNVTVLIQGDFSSANFDYDFELNTRSSLNNPVQSSTNSPPKNKASLCEELLKPNQRSNRNFTLNFDSSSLPPKFHTQHNHVTDTGRLLLCHWSYTTPRLAMYPFNVTIGRVRPIANYSSDRFSMNYTYLNRTHSVNLNQSSTIYLIGNSTITFNILIKSLNTKVKYSFEIYGHVSSRVINCSNPTSEFKFRHHFSHFSPNKSFYQPGDVVRLVCQEGFYQQSSQNIATCNITGSWSFQSLNVCRASCYSYNISTKRMNKVVRNEYRGLIYSPNYPNKFNSSKSFDKFCMSISLDQSMEIGLVTNYFHLENSNVQIHSLSTNRTFTISETFKLHDPFDLLLGNAVKIIFIKKNKQKPYELKFQINYTSRALKSCSELTVKNADVIRGDLGYLKGFKANIKCRENFHLLGQSVSICKNGLWTPAIADCLLHCGHTSENVLLIQDRPIYITGSDVNSVASNGTTCVWKVQTPGSNVNVIQLWIHRCEQDKACHSSARYLDIDTLSGDHFRCDLIINNNDNCSQPLYIYSNSILRLRFVNNPKRLESTFNITLKKRAITKLCEDNLPESRSDIKYTVNKTDLLLTCRNEGFVVIGNRTQKCQISSNGTITWSPKIQSNCMRVCSSHQKVIVLSKENPSKIFNYESLSSNSNLIQRDCNFKIFVQGDMVIVIKLKDWNMKSIINVRRLDNGKLIEKLNYFQDVGTQIICSFSCQVEFIPIFNSMSVEEQTFGKLEIVIKPQNQAYPNQSQKLSSPGFAAGLCILLFLLSLAVIGGLVYHNQYYYPYTGWVSKLRNSVSTMTLTSRPDKDNTNQIEELAHYNPPMSVAENRINEFKDRNKTFHLRRSVPPNSLIAAKKQALQKRREALLRRSSDITDQIKVVAGLPNENIESDDVFGTEETCVDDIRTEMTDVSFTLTLSTVSEADSQAAEDICENRKSLEISDDNT